MNPTITAPKQEFIVVMMNILIQEAQETIDSGGSVGASFDTALQDPEQLA